MGGSDRTQQPTQGQQAAGGNPPGIPDKRQQREFGNPDPLVGILAQQLGQGFGNEGVLAAALNQLYSPVQVPIFSNPAEYPEYAGNPMAQQSTTPEAYFQRYPQMAPQPTPSTPASPAPMQPQQPVAPPMLAPQQPINRDPFRFGR